MNEQAEKVLVDLLEKVSDGIDSTTVFSQSQLPDVINQLLTWNMVLGVFCFVIGICCLSLGVYIPSWAGKARARGESWTFHDKDKRYNITSGAYDACRSLAPVVFILFGLLMAVGGAIEFLKILLVPKLYLIEYAASLIK